MSGRGKRRRQSPSPPLTLSELAAQAPPSSSSSASEASPRFPEYHDDGVFITGPEDGGARGVLHRLFDPARQRQLQEGREATQEPASQVESQDPNSGGGREEIFLGTFGRNSNASGSPPQLPGPATFASGVFPSTSSSLNARSTQAGSRLPERPPIPSVLSSKRKREEVLDPRAHWAADEEKKQAQTSTLDTKITAEGRAREAKSSLSHNTFGDDERQESLYGSDQEGPSSSVEAHADDTSTSRGFQRHGNTAHNNVGGGGANIGEGGNIGRGERGGLASEHSLHRLWTPEQEEQRTERRQEEQRLYRQSLSSDTIQRPSSILGPNALRPTSVSFSSRDNSSSAPSDERRRTSSSLVMGKPSVYDRSANRLSPAPRPINFGPVNSPDDSTRRTRRGRPSSEPRHVSSSPSTEVWSTPAPIAAPASSSELARGVSSPVAGSGERGGSESGLEPRSVGQGQGHARVASLPATRPPRTSFQEPTEGMGRSPRVSRAQGHHHHRSSSNLNRRDLTSAQQSTPMAKRFSGGGRGVSSIDVATTPGLTTTTSGRPSWSTMLAHQARAQASFHLTALYALQPRFPPRHSHIYAQLKYKSIWPRLHHRLLLLCTYLHVPATFFLDFSALYALIDIAAHPDAESNDSAAWWIASGIYAASLLAWFVGVVLLWELVYLYHFKRAAGTNFSSSSSVMSSTKPHKANMSALVMPTYLSASSFTLTAVESLGKYSLLFRARLAASRRDMLIETFWFYSQNWPTIVTLLPRGVILTVLLVLYHPGQSSGRPATSVRDPTYFDPISGLLVRFSYVLLLVNVAWMLWRLALVLVSYVGLFITVGVQSFVSEGVIGSKKMRKSVQPQSTSSRALLMGASQSEHEGLPWHSAPRLDSAATHTAAASGQTGDEQGGRNSDAIGLDEEAAMDAEREIREGADPTLRQTNTQPFPRFSQKERFSSQPHEYLKNPNAWKERAEDRIRSLLLEAEEASGEGEDGMMMMMAGAGPLSPPTPATLPAIVGASSAGPVDRRSRSQMSDDFGLGRREGLRATGVEREERGTSYLNGDTGPPTTASMTSTPPALTSPYSSVPALSPLPFPVAGPSTAAVATPMKPSSSNDIEQLETPISRSQPSQGASFDDSRVSPSFPFPATAESTPTMTAVEGGSGNPLMKQQQWQRLGLSNESLEATRRSSRGEAGRTSSHPMTSTPPPPPLPPPKSMQRTNSSHASRTTAVPAIASVSQPKVNEATQRQRQSQEDERLVRTASPAPTSSSDSDEDSEEMRLWATFPEQSRRHPPGLIALELEEQRRERLRQNSKEMETLGGDGGRGNANGGGGGDSIVEEEEEEEEEREKPSIRRAQREEAGYGSGSAASASLSTTATGGSGSVGGASVSSSSSGGGGGVGRTSMERPEETLLPIKEESWGSSLDGHLSTAANSNEK